MLNFSFFSARDIVKRHRDVRVRVLVMVFFYNFGFVFFSYNQRLTYDAIAGAAGLRSATVDVKIGVTAGAPLTQDSGRRVYDVHEMRVRGVEVSGPVVGRIK